MGGYQIFVFKDIKALKGRRSMLAIVKPISFPDQVKKLEDAAGSTVGISCVQHEKVKRRNNPYKKIKKPQQQRCAVRLDSARFRNEQGLQLSVEGMKPGDSLSGPVPSGRSSQASGVHPCDGMMVSWIKGKAKNRLEAYPEEASTLLQSPTQGLQLNA